MALTAGIRRAATIIGVLAAVVGGAPAGAAAGTTSTIYRLTDLGTLGGESSYPIAMNDRGHVAGGSQTADGTWHGFLWRGGRMIDLGLFLPTDMNNRDELIGTIDYGPGGHLWRAGRLIDLGSLGGPFTTPVAINDRGQVVGMSSTATEPHTPFLWSRGRMRAVPLDDVSDINNRGQITGGRLHGPDGFHATLWSRARVTDLGAGPFDRSNTIELNDRGWVIGWQFTPSGDEHGVLWRHGTRIDLGPPDSSSHAEAINNRGQIIGTSPAGPFLWERGVMTDPATLGIAEDAELACLNDRGEIAVSYRTVQGTSHAGVYRPLSPSDDSGSVPAAAR